MMRDDPLNRKETDTLPRISPRPGPGREKPDGMRPSGGRASGAAPGYSPRATPWRTGTAELPRRTPYPSPIQQNLMCGRENRSLPSLPHSRFRCRGRNRRRPPRPVIPPEILARGYYPLLSISWIDGTITITTTTTTATTMSNWILIPDVHHGSPLRQR